MHPLVWIGLLLLIFTGNTNAAVFSNPIINNGADPWVIRVNGNYFYTHTTGNGVVIRRSPYLTGIANAAPTQVFTPPAPYNKNVWAPELHYLQGKWYLYYAADDGNNANHRMFVAEATTANPQGTYTFKGQITDPSNRWAIDGTVLEKDDGSLYFIWSGWPGTTDGLQNLYIAPMSDPWTISGPRVLISTPQYSWESWINEGPQVIKRNGKIFIIYSANRSWTDDYCLAMLTNTDGDVLNPASWTKHPQPVFKRYSGPNGAVYGPGHASFTTSIDGTENWILYHAAKSSGSGWDRNVRMQPFTWNPDDSPNFGTPIPAGVFLNVPSGEGTNTLTVSHGLGGGVTRIPQLPTYPQNYVVTVTASTSPGYMFLGWQGDVTSTENPITIKMDSNKSITALFTNQLILDNNAALLTGTWSTGTIAEDKFGTDYRFAHLSNSVTHTATYIPNIPATANYDVFAWYPQGPNRATSVRYDISSVSGVVTTNLNQQIEGGGWRLLAAGKPFLKGTNGSVRISNQGTDSSKVIMADAIRFTLSADQHMPPFVTAHPGDWRGMPGETASFQAEFGGTPPFTFQWRHNGINIPDATNAVLHLGNIQAADAGYYSLEISNARGSAVTSNALAVVELPLSLHPVTQSDANVFRMKIEGTLGNTNWIEVSTNLVDWTVLTNIVMTGSIVEFSESTSAASQRFYRVRPAAP